MERVLGRRPPFHTPVYVLTHHVRKPQEMEGGTTFQFITDGIESALEQAKDASGGKDVSLGGGANVIQQYLAARLLDEIEISRPGPLGNGERLFDNLSDDLPELEQVDAVKRQPWHTSDTGYSISPRCVNRRSVRQPRTSSGRRRETPPRRRSCRRYAR